MLCSAAQSYAVLCYAALSAVLTLTMTLAASPPPTPPPILLLVLLLLPLLLLQLLLLFRSNAQIGRHLVAKSAKIGMLQHRHAAGRTSPLGILAHSRLASLRDIRITACAVMIECDEEYAFHNVFKTFMRAASRA